MAASASKGSLTPLKIIASAPLSYQSAGHLRQGYRRFPHRADVIYYRINQDWIDVMTILGSQDVDAWLQNATTQTVCIWMGLASQAMVLFNK